MRTRVWLRHHWFDLLLGLVFLGSGILFLHRAWWAEQESGIGIVVARQTHGTAKRKPLGQIEFESAQAGTDFFNLDAIWVGPEQFATLETPEGMIMDLGEKTLLVLRKPFRPKSRPEDQFHLISGSVSIREPYPVKFEILGKGFNEIPDEKKVTAAQQKEDLRVFPDPGASIIQDGSEPFALSWAFPASGHLVISNKTTGQVFYIPLTQQSYAEAALPPGFTYLWQVVDMDRKTLVGPFQFTLLHPGKNAVRNEVDATVKSGDESRVIHISR